MLFDLEQGSVISQQDENGTVTTLILSTVGVTLSGLALLLLLITACLFPEWRRNYKNQLLIQFMLARCLYTFVRYFFDIRTLFQLCENKLCIIYLDETMMVYSEIALVGWMLVFSRQMYESLVKVFSPKTPNIWKVSMSAWIAPIIATLVMYGLSDWKKGNDLRVFFLYLAIFKWPVLVANATVLILILKSLIEPTKINMKSASNKPRLVITMSILIFFFCFQQAFMDIYRIFYVFLDLPPFLLYFTNIGTMFHCALAILFWVFGNTKTRIMWRNKLCCSSIKIPLSPQSSVESAK